VVVSILSGVYLLPYVGFGFRNPTALLLIGFKLLMAYFGQYCHRMSHTHESRQPNWVKSFQKLGLMISTKEHMMHHKSYDSNFCIGSGVCNPLLTWLLNNISSNKWICLGFFLFSSVFDVPIFNYVLKSTCGFH